MVDFHYLYNNIVGTSNIAAVVLLLLLLLLLLAVGLRKPLWTERKVIGEIVTEISGI